MTKRFIPFMAATMLIVGATLPAPAARAESSGQPVARGRAVSSYSDVSESHWAYPSVAKLLEAGVLAPDQSGKFHPEAAVSRAEVLKMLFAARGIDTGSECAGFFTDAPCWAWYAPAVENAYRMAIDDGRGNGTFGPDGQVSRQELLTTMIRATGLRRKAETLSSGEVGATLKPFSDSRQIADWARSSVALRCAAELHPAMQTAHSAPERPPPASRPRSQSAGCSWPRKVGRPSPVKGPEPPLWRAATL